MSADIVTACIFAKPPRAGLAKTRLIPAVGAQGAATLAAAFLTDTLARLHDLPDVRPVLATTVDGHKHGFESSIWPNSEPGEVWIQPESTLDRRIELILQRALRRSSVAWAVGADSPGVPDALYAAAQAAFQTHDAVLGPTKDGGFWLLGLRACPEGLLSDVPWSAHTTAECTENALRRVGMRVLVLPMWWDVDEPEDLRRLSTVRSAHCPATLRAAEALGLRIHASPHR